MSLLQIQLAHWQHKTKFSKIQVRHLISSLLPSDPAYIVYSAHLAAITLFTSPITPSNTLISLSSSRPISGSSFPSPNYTNSAQDIHAALSAVSNLQVLAHSKSHPQVILFSHVLRLRILVAANMWADVGASLQLAETAFGLSYAPVTTPKPRQGKENVDSNAKTPQGKEHAVKPDASDNKDEFISFEDPFESAMVVHTLMMGIVYFTHIGSAAEATPRLSHLHALLDSGALEQFPDGTVQVRVSLSCSSNKVDSQSRLLCLLGEDPRWSTFGHPGYPSTNPLLACVPH